MKIDFDTNSWHARLYRFTYNSEPQDSLCPYFWSIVYATIMFPFSYLGSRTGQIGLSRSNVDAGTRFSFATSFMLFLLFVFCLAIYELFLILMTPTGALVMGVTFVFAIIMMILMVTHDLWRAYLYAVYKRFCPIITWKREDK